MNAHKEYDKMQTNTEDGADTNTPKNCKGELI